jgi:hypothetical protein
VGRGGIFLTFSIFRLPTGGPPPPNLAGVKGWERGGCRSSEGTTIKAALAQRCMRRSIESRITLEGG